MSFLFLRSALDISIFLEQRDFTTENDVECIAIYFDGVEKAERQTS